MSIVSERTLKNYECFCILSETMSKTVPGAVFGVVTALSKTLPLNIHWEEMSEGVLRHRAESVHKLPLRQCRCESPYAQCQNALFATVSYVSIRTR